MLLQQLMCCVEVPVVRHHHPSLPLQVGKGCDHRSATTTAGMRARPIAPGRMEHESCCVLAFATAKLLRSEVGLDLLLLPLMCANRGRHLSFHPPAHPIGLHHQGNLDGIAAIPAHRAPPPILAMYGPNSQHQAAHSHQQQALL